MLISKKKKLWMVALIKLLHREMKYHMKMMMEMRRPYREDN
jgi:hypothetical protein